MITKTKLSKSDLLSRLEKNWSDFLTSIESMNSDELNSYLEKQGYKRIADLLAHILSWWEETIRVVPLKLAGEKPNYSWKSVDDFNKKAIEKFNDLDKETVIELFHKTQKDFKTFIESLEETQIHNGKVYHWIYNGIEEHYLEHKV